MASAEGGKMSRRGEAVDTPKASHHRNTEWLVGEVTKRQGAREQHLNSPRQVSDHKSSPHGKRGGTCF